MTGKSKNLEAGREANKAEEFLIAFSEAGKLASMSYRGTLKENFRENHRRLSSMMVRLAWEIALARESQRKLERVVLMKGTDAVKFIGGVLVHSREGTAPAKNKDWYSDLCGLRNGGKCILKWEESAIFYDPPHDGTMLRVIVHKGAVVFASDTSGSDELKQFLENGSSGNAVNYGAELGVNILESAKRIKEELATSHPAGNTFAHAQRAISDVKAKRDCLDMHMTSLILPVNWYRTTGWRVHNEQIRHVAAAASAGNPQRRHRRLHILAEETMSDAVQVIALADLMLLDLSYGVDSRVLTVSSETYQHTDKREGIPRVGNVLLLDHGIFSNSLGTYRIILSDIKPFEDQPREFALYAVPEESERDVYYYLRGRFHEAWLGLQNGFTRWMIRDVLKRAEEMQIPADLKLGFELQFFKGKKPVEIPESIKELLIDFPDAKLSDDEEYETVFRKSFEKKYAKYHAPNDEK